MHAYTRDDVIWAEIFGYKMFRNKRKTVPSETDGNIASETPDLCSILLRKYPMYESI